jgi:hypothetical protein
MKRASIAALLILCACSSAPKQQTAAHLATALSATNAARESFVDYDKSHQIHLVSSSTNAAEVKERISAYRAKRQIVVRAFTIAYSTISAAGTALAAIEHQKKGADLDVATMLLDATHAVLDVKRAIDALKGVESANPPASN